MQSVYDFLRKAKVYHLATVEGDQPRVRPFGTVDLFEGRLYIQTGKVKNVSKQMQANPKVEISAMRGDEWIRIEGKVVRDDRLEAKTHMMETFPELLTMYNPADENTEVLYLKDAVATIYSFTKEPEEIRFG